MISPVVFLTCIVHLESVSRRVAFLASSSDGVQCGVRLNGGLEDLVSYGVYPGRRSSVIGFLGICCARHRVRPAESSGKQFSMGHRWLLGNPVLPVGLVLSQPEVHRSSNHGSNCSGDRGRAENVCSTPQLEEGFKFGDFSKQSPAVGLVDRILRFSACGDLYPRVYWSSPWPSSTFPYWDLPSTSEKSENILLERLTLPSQIIRMRLSRGIHQIPVVGVHRVPVWKVLGVRRRTAFFFFLISEDVTWSGIVEGVMPSPSWSCWW